MEEIVVIFGGAVIGFTLGAFIGTKGLSKASQMEFIPLFAVASAGMFAGAVATKFYLDYKRRAF